MTNFLLIFLSIIVVVFMATVLFGAPFVPTHQKQLKKLVKCLKLSKNDVLVDLGSGDGRVLNTFAPKINRAIGYEINPFLVFLSKIRCFKNKNISIKMTDFRLEKLPQDTTIIYIFYADTFKKSVLKLIKNHKKSLIVISYGFQFEELGAGKRKHGFWIYKT